MSEEEDETPALAKDVFELTLEDLLRHPVWEYGVDDFWDFDSRDPIDAVRPFGEGDPEQVNPDGGFVIRADFDLADGVPMIGFVIAREGEDHNDLSNTRPTIITERGHVCFWCGLIKPEPSVVRENYIRLWRGAPRVFPVTFETFRNELGIKISGVLPGFLYFASDAETVCTVK